ncbi:hypothetical protein C0992_008398 [Termitomyces sp. T32_za158]|nr:hypothetical protein C0992_008398 [Termitomyces sp. T32_za158]
MPPLVEPPSSMTYTFLTEMAPMSLDQTAPLEATFTSTASSATIEELDSYEQSYTFSGPTRTYHGKRRDASYIPRPPNAFILFRSSFIREQQVPANVEGMFWKNLPKSERDTWEAKAAQAQVEHRRRYPDWRFQPGANAAANAKEIRYVLDGDGGGRRRLRTRIGIGGTKDPPDRGGDEEAQAFQDGEEEEEDNMDDDDDSDYEERKAKGKRKATAKARSTRGRRPTKKVEKQSVELHKFKAKATPATPRDKEKEKERIKKIVGFLVEGKKGVELEEAVDEWEMNGWRSSTAGRRNVDADKDKGSGAVIKVDVQAPCSPTANHQLTFRAKPLPLIITVNPSPPSAPSPMLAPTPHSPAVSLLSPALTSSPTVPPPSPPEFQEEAQGQAQGMKRSSSAPAPDMRIGVPQVRNQMQGQGEYLLEGGQGQLGYGPAQGWGGTKKRACSSASFPASKGVDAAGEKNKEMPRRETVSLPLTRMDAGSRRWRFIESVYEGNKDAVSDSVTSTFGSQEKGIFVASPSREGYVSPTAAASAFRGEGKYMPAGPNSNDDSSAATTASSALNFYYPASPAPPPPALTPPWDQQQATYATTSMNWWPSSVSADSRSTHEHYEPIREGSFEQSYEYPYGHATAGESGYGKVYGEMETRYLQTFPAAEQERTEYTSIMQKDSEHKHENEQQWSPSNASSPSIPTLPLTMQAHEPKTNTTTSTDACVDADTDAGSIFRPLVPSRMSTFSSLTGWDGSKGAEGPEGGTSGSRDACFVGGGGGGGVHGGGKAQGQGPGPWYGWGTMQSFGLGGGRTWEGTAADVGVSADTSGGEDRYGARKDRGGGDVM